MCANTASARGERPGNLGFSFVLLRCMGWGEVQMFPRQTNKTEIGLVGNEVDELDVMFFLSEFLVVGSA